MGIDEDTLAIEQRIAQRRLRIELLAGAAKRRVTGTLFSPVNLAGAGLLGVLAVTGVLRRHRHSPRSNERSRGRGGLLGSLAGVAASAALSLGVAMIHAQLGSPSQIAQKVLLMFRRKSPAGDSRQAQHERRSAGAGR